jgi:hypothetical protein
MQSGQLTVTSEGSTSILLTGRPREVFVRFKREPDPVPCNPHHHDNLHYRIKFEDEDPHVHAKLGHRHHDRLFYLVVEWRVEGLREIEWCVIY